MVQWWVWLMQGEARAEIAIATWVAWFLEGRGGASLVVALGLVVLGFVLGRLDRRQATAQQREELIELRSVLAEYTEDEEQHSRRLMAELRMPARRVAGLGPEAA